MKIAILPVAAAMLMLSACTETTKTENETNNQDTAVLTSSADPAPTARAEDAWAAVDWNSPIIKYDEVKSSDVSIRGTDNYGLYGLGENILFETGKANLKSGAESKLKEVATSINQRYGDGKVKVYGYTDATGADDANKALSRERAEAVKTWLVSNGNIADNRISVYAEGESRPAATNENAEGREQNRRVEIAAMK